MSTSHHIHSTIDDLLAMPLSDFERQFRGCCTGDDGKVLTTQEARTELVGMKYRGIGVVMYGDCDNWDLQTGCRGHQEG